MEEAARYIVVLITSESVEEADHKKEGGLRQYRARD